MSSQDTAASDAQYYDENVVMLRKSGERNGPPSLGDAFLNGGRDLEELLDFLEELDDDDL